MILEGETNRSGKKKRIKKNNKAVSTRPIEPREPLEKKASRSLLMGIVMTGGYS